MTHPRRLLVATVIAGALVAGTTACTPDDRKPTPTATTTTAPTPSPTPTPTPTPTLDPVQEQIGEARAAYEHYNAVDNAVQQAGMAGWQDQVIPLVGGDYREVLVNYYTQASQQGLRQTGETAIASLTVTEHIPDPSGGGGEQVRMEACLDTSDSDIVNPEGASVTQPGFPDRLITAVLMQRQADGRWTVNAAETLQDRPC
ncbi:hypothetical protein [Cellulomonas marina]|uniref:Mce-associated membrane protein n=1 Tax=Cellulomonas marina TaxID=988821 RepID=A0A1I1AVB1_9CELL|nr:hypothetical protein [Cellulomonas marina]GIG29272.1 hypothetical protein Cma02nite_18720 [Cellulomonas marina]SFB40368.1 hypothetical protein SAMN05421867_12151 [Cellulomonas marina]